MPTNVSAGRFPLAHLPVSSRISFSFIDNWASRRMLRVPTNSNIAKIGIIAGPNNVSFFGATRKVRLIPMTDRRLYKK
jgi:hypothetical protein